MSENNLRDDSSAIPDASLLSHEQSFNLPYRLYRLYRLYGLYRLQGGLQFGHFPRMQLPVDQDLERSDPFAKT